MDIAENELNQEILELSIKHNVNAYNQYESDQFFKDVNLLLDRKKSHIMKKIKNKERKDKLKKINETTNNEEDTI
jgi:hypothetical protein